MLMDLFFQQSPVVHKRRAHFHEFMAEVHERIYGFRQNIARGEIPDGDVIALTAKSIFDQAWLLCFDEFHVTDIADAMILGRLFASCSNSAPWWWQHPTSRRMISTRAVSTGRCSCPSLRRYRRTWMCCGSTRAPISGWKSSRA